MIMCIPVARIPEPRLLLCVCVCKSNRFEMCHSTAHKNPSSRPPKRQAITWQTGGGVQRHIVRSALAEAVHRADTVPDRVRAVHVVAAAHAQAGR